MQKDSVGGTLVIAAVLCVACSVLVAGAAVLLKPMQDENKILDVKKNMLLASGLIDNPKASKDEINEAFKQVSPMIINLETGDLAADVQEPFSQRKAAKTPGLNLKIPADKDIAGIKTRSKFAKIYKVMNGESIQMYIFPVHGKGLWSTLYGFLALAPDFMTVKGLGFYEHAETPGLGGEIDNPDWKAQWVGKKVFDQKMALKLQVIKGAVDGSDPEKDYKIDGLSGATITSDGVTKLVKYWLGEDGFGPFIKKNMKDNNEFAKN